jgi:murein DD-endopeptidase MepM/ murein hydrolase activator NlpD
VDERRVGLYHQLAWAANELNRGYYLWKVNAVSTFILGDGTSIPANPTVNAGTVAVQRFLGLLNTRDVWEDDISAFGFFQTYYFMFGNPFDLAIEPLFPYGLKQPQMQLPFELQDTWSFTGGPHGGWDSGSAWAAIDFGPPGLAGGCNISDTWVAAVTNGFIVRASNGAVIQDIDGDGFEQTGWNILYMHISYLDRVQAGDYVYAGERIGHPSCEGGISNASHLHLARKYNGEWVPADGTLPFTMDGWTTSGNGREYDGFLNKGSQTIEAWDGANDLNQISR